MILTLPIVLYQLLFVAILAIANRFGRVALAIAAVACLAWTSTHVFFPPLAVLQTVVIAVTTLVLFRRPARASVQDAPAPGRTE